MRKLVFLFILAVLLPLFPVRAFAQKDTPKPPMLYSQAAVLMDAATGQVLWGKNMNTRMYPASLTKVLTCLIAMEKGNPADTVTMTDEGVFSVPRNTTHAALTSGEQLTLEQLEYVMMVESANDAANGIAVHLGGSLKGFAEMMNQKAAEIGAVNSHFTNANGLPENDHYTTAYDLGLLTKEALKYPQFRSLAGTQTYEIPPTNKQAKTRRFSNKQYMFCLNDIYPGAFAGKTGWTQEAGKTLITIAERDGITLISVVLKAAGTVDAEFKDSTALLDYGYDNFKRVEIPASKVPAKEITYTSEAGKQAKAMLQRTAPMQVLLPKNLSAQDLTPVIDQADPANPVVKLVAPSVAEDYMDPAVGSFLLTMKPLQTAVTPAETPKPSLFAFIPGFLAGAAKPAFALGGLVGILFLYRHYNIQKRRKLRKLHAQQRAAERRASSTPLPSAPTSRDASSPHSQPHSSGNERRTTPGLRQPLPPRKRPGPRPPNRRIP